MTPVAKAALLDVPVLAVGVALEIDPTKVLAWVAAAFFAALAWFIQREWNRHEKAHDVIDARHHADRERFQHIEARLHALESAE